MKKFVALAVSAIFLLGFAAAAFAIHAEIPTGTQAVYSDEGTFLDVGGDMRVRGVWRGNHTDFDDALTLNDQRLFDQRYRLTFIVKTDNDIEARMRAVFGQNYVWGGDNAYSVKVGPGGTCSLCYTTYSIGPSRNWVEWDWAYLHIPIMGFTIDVGRQRANWGLKFLGWDDPVDRIKILTHAGDVLLGFLYDKVAEETPFTNFNRQIMGQDQDKYGALAVYSAEGVTVGILALYFIDDSNTVDTAPQSSDTAWAGSVYGTVNIADTATLKGEFAVKGGYLAGTSTTGSRDTQYGGFVGVVFPLEAVSIHGNIAFTKNGYTADNYWAPTVMIGTVNPTAMFNFGANGDSWLLQAGVDWAVSDTWTLGGKIAYLNIDTYAVGDPDGSVWEVDAQARYKLAKNTTYYIDFGWMRPENMTSDDNNAFSLGKIEMTF